MLSGLAETIDHAPAGKFWTILVVLAMIVLWLFFRGFGQLRRARMIEDMPTSRIRSASQGYVELEGWAAALPGEPVYAPLSGRLCVWYHYSIDHLESRWYRGRHDLQWISIEQGHSEHLFALEDPTGRCVIDPEGAEIQPAHVLSWQGHERYPRNTPPAHGDISGPYRYRERWIEPGEPLYALGWFDTLTDPVQQSLGEKTKDLLRSWKENQAGLLSRFDLNRDGQIDSREWELVRRQAAKEVLRQQGSEKPAEAVHLLRKPAHRNHPFILAVDEQQALASRFRYGALGAMCFFVLGCAAIAWSVQERFN